MMIMEDLTSETIELLKVLAATSKCATTEEIMKITSLSQEVVEAHLEVLRQQGLISNNTEGKHCSLDDVRKLQEKFRACEKCFPGGHAS